MPDPTRYFYIEDKKPPAAKWPVPIDISNWLGTETLDVVTYTAKRLDTGEDATAEVLDLNNSVETTTQLKPFVQGGSGEITYQIKCHVTTVEGSEDDFFIQFTVKDYGA